MSEYIITYGGKPLTRVAGQNHFLSYDWTDWVPMTWQYDRIPTYGDNVWKRSDTGGIYYSQKTGTSKNYSLSYVQSGGTRGFWGDTSWSGLSEFDGRHVWNSVNGKTYYSYSYVSPSYEPGNYVLITPSGSNAYWSSKSWNTLTLIGENMWNDGNTDYSDDTYYHILENDTWGIAVWIKPDGGGTPDYGKQVWKDSLGHIYYSNGTYQCLIEPSNPPQGSPSGTWYTKTWYGLTSFYGEDVWRDVKTGRIFYSNGTTQYILNESTSTWSPWTWQGLKNYYGRYVWTDGNRMFYSNGDSNQYVLNW